MKSIYVRTLTRKPTPEETQQLMEIVKQAENPELGLQDVFWAVLNARSSCSTTKDLVITMRCTAVDGLGPDLGIPGSRIAHGR